MVKYCASRYEIEAARLHCPAMISALRNSKSQIHVNQRKIEVDGMLVHPERPAVPATPKLSRCRNQLPAFLPQI